MKLRILCLLAIASIFSGSLYAQTEADNPVFLVESITGKILSDVTNNLEEYTENPEALKDLVHRDLMPLLDINYSARLILGRAGRGIEKEKIEEFATSMSNLLIDRYAMALLQFSSKIKLQVLPQRGDLNEKLTRVKTRVTLPNGSEAPVDYVFRKTPDGWKAFDVVLKAYPISPPTETRSCPRYRLTALIALSSD